MIQDIGHVVGSESAGLVRFLEGSPNRIRPILTNQVDQFPDLTGKDSITAGQFLQIGLGCLSEQSY